MLKIGVNGFGRIGRLVLRALLEKNETDLKIELNESNEMNFDFRRNLETESTEFYTLAYNYLNDCLRAGVVFRRKFYEDRDIEHSDSLMFKISLIPLGDAFAPAIK